MANLYETLMKQEKENLTRRYQGDIKRLEKEIAKLKTTIEKINDNDIFWDDDNDGCALLDVQDRINILEHMEKNFSKTQLSKITKRGIGLMFYHVDNIRYVYEEEGVKCPRWFVKKYESKLKL